MSFLIEDILKKDIHPNPSIKNMNRSISVDNSSAFDTCILQQTLTNNNRANFPHHYNRSISEQYLRIHDIPTSNGKFQGCYSSPSSSCDDFNNPRMYSWPSLINRNPNTVWPSYMNPYHPMTMVYPQYVHYSKRKGGQVRFSTNQTEALEKRFVAHKYLSPEDRRVLAESLKLSDRQVKTWFQNRRAKWRRSISTSSGSGMDRPTESSDSEEEPYNFSKKLN